MRRTTGLAAEIRAALARKDLDTFQLQAACPKAKGMSTRKFCNNLAGLVHHGVVVATGKVNTYSKVRGASLRKSPGKRLHVIKTHDIAQRVKVWALREAPALKLKPASNLPSWLERRAA